MSSEIVKVQKNYNEKVKVAGWQLNAETFPKDSGPTYNPKVSTYHRLGSQDVPNPKSETHAALESIYKTPKKPFGHRPLVNFVSFHTTFRPYAVQNLIKSGLTLYPDDYGEHELISTHRHDYVPYNGEITKKFDPEEYYRRETKFRRLLTDWRDSKRKGFNKFLDDNMGYLDAKKGKTSRAPYALHTEDEQQ